MIAPRFHTGQRVVCVDATELGNVHGLIEGKTYYVEIANYPHPHLKENTIAITLHGIWACYDQERFMTYEEDFIMSMAIQKLMNEVYEESDGR